MTEPVHMHEETPDTGHDIRDERADAPHISRPLLIAVIVMGVLIIIGIVSLAGVIVHRVFAPGQSFRLAPGPELIEMAPADMTAISAKNIARLGLALKTGEHVLSAVPYRNGRVLVLLGQGGNGAEAHITRIIAWQPETARLLAELDAVSAPEQHP